MFLTPWPLIWSNLLFTSVIMLLSESSASRGSLIGESRTCGTLARSPYPSPRRSVRSSCTSPGVAPIDTPARMHLSAPSLPDSLGPDTNRIASFESSAMLVTVVINTHRDGEPVSGERPAEAFVPPESCEGHLRVGRAFGPLRLGIAASEDLGRWQSVVGRSISECIFHAERMREDASDLVLVNRE